MKKISSDKITHTVSRLCIEANIYLRKDIKTALGKALKIEKAGRAKMILKQILENAKAAQEDRVALCQDTGFPTVFVEIGRDVDISGMNLTAAIQKGIREGYKKGYLRNSIVADPLLRPQKTEFTPGIIHFDFGTHKGIKITVLPKGFGCENKTQLKMFTPTVSVVEIKRFILSVVQEAGPDACPPYVVGVGIGGSADYAVYLAKKALLRPVNQHSALANIRTLEKELFKKINQSGIGPMGLGGKTTVLGVNILTHPTHIAGLPVAVNISCHVSRSASAVLE